MIGADLFVDLVASLRLFKGFFATACLKLGDKGAGDDHGVVFVDSRTGVSSDLSLPFPKVFKLSAVRWLVDNE